MPEIDRVKEEIGWLKVVFVLFIAADFSLIGWLAQNFGLADRLQAIVAVVGVLVITSGVVWINRMAYLHFQKLEKL